jgi:hypothetical protein
MRNLGEHRYDDRAFALSFRTPDLSVSTAATCPMYSRWTLTRICFVGLSRVQQLIDGVDGRIRYRRPHDAYAPIFTSLGAFVHQVKAISAARLHCFPTLVKRILFELQMIRNSGGVPPSLRFSYFQLRHNRLRCCWRYT